MQPERRDSAELCKTEQGWRGVGWGEGVTWQIRKQRGHNHKDSHPHRTLLSSQAVPKAETGNGKILISINSI